MCRASVRAPDPAIRVTRSGAQADAYQLEIGGLTRGAFAAPVRELAKPAELARQRDYDRCFGPMRLAHQAVIYGRRLAAKANFEPLRPGGMLGTMLTAWLDRTLYPDHTDRWDERLLRERVLAALPSNARVLDLGAGAGVVPELNSAASLGRSAALTSTRA